MPSAPIWVAFVASNDDGLSADAPPVSRLVRYRIDAVVGIAGPQPMIPARGWTMARLESQTPPGIAGQTNGRVVFRGVTQHVHYTDGAKRSELGRRPHPELPNSPETIAVLIPIAKSPGWWELAQDERQAHFDRGGGNEGHTNIGLRYADRIYRSLYHCRYADNSNPFDFLTYFEFENRYTRDFRDLLGKLRDVDQNPEWRYVTREFEVWMTKTG
jgi:hypothetical protein